MSPTRGTRLIADFDQVSLDLSSVRNRVVPLKQEEQETNVEFEISRQETQLRVIGTLSTSLYTKGILTRTHNPSPITESSRSRLVTSYRVGEHLHHQLRHTALYYVTNLEYLVIANHLSASGLRLAPQLTHTSSGQHDNRGAGDSA